MTDTQIERGIWEFLKARHISGIHCFQVAVRHGVANIRGHAGSAFAKWACYECCRRVTGVVRVIDEIEVAHA